MLSVRLVLMSCGLRFFGKELTIFKPLPQQAFVHEHLYCLPLWLSHFTRRRQDAKTLLSILSGLGVLRETLCKSLASVMLCHSRAFVLLR